MNFEGENLALIKTDTQFHSFLELPSMFIFHNIHLLREMQKAIITEEIKRENYLIYLNLLFYILF